MITAQQASDHLELAALAALIDCLPDHEHAASLQTIADAMKVDREVARLALRLSRRNGRSIWMRGLQTDQGEVAGAGYTYTKQGKEYLEAQKCQGIEDTGVA